MTGGNILEYKLLIFDKVKQIQYRDVKSYPITYAGL